MVISPLIPRKKQSFNGAFRTHIMVIMIYSILISLAQLIFQLFLVIYASVSDEDYGEVLHPNGTSCSLVYALQMIGFQRVDAPSEELYHSFRLLLPDAVMVIVSVITFITLTKLYKVSEQSDSPAPKTSSRKSGALKKYVETFGALTIFLLMGACAAMVPSAISVFYFLMFFGILIYYSLHLPFEKKSYGVLKMVIYVYVCCHMVLLYLCQFHFLQTWLDAPENVYYSRIIGMTPLVKTTCEEPWAIELEDHSWPYFVNPLVLFLLFTVLGIDYSYRRDRPATSLTNSMESSSLSRADSLRSSERQLLVAERQPNYDSIGSQSPAEETALQDVPDAAASQNSNKY
ncbi:piezo-type mechanosensitive ion channel component 1-like [Watersipora subatra]|uniref:piezo-type mechanosensitive ion channel component 1-like n=1 Tax=Watersipora subatra TaxID=2589382 RepID=UPI00355B7ADE